MMRFARGTARGAAIDRTATRNPIKSMNLTEIVRTWSHAVVAVATELYRRPAVDLLRVASALCPVH
jgi:hypothetical protein